MKNVHCLMTAGEVPALLRVPGARGVWRVAVSGGVRGFYDLGSYQDFKIIRKPRASCSRIRRLCCSAWTACRSPMQGPGRAARWRYGRSRIGLLRVFRTAKLVLIHAASCRFRYSSWTSCGVL